MNLETAIAQADAAKLTTKSKKGLKSLLVAPAADTLPNDGFLNYVTVASVYDFGKIEDGAAVLVSIEQLGLLKLICANTELFELTIRVLTGVPGADYGIGFDQVVWNLESVAYAPLLSELALDAEIAKQKAETESSVYDKEMRRVTRSDGTVKLHNEFSVATASPMADTDDSVVE